MNKSRQPAKNSYREWATFARFFKTSFLNEIQELRHHRKHADIPLLQRPQELGCVQSFEVNNPCPLYQRQQQIRHLRQRMKKRKDAEDDIIGSNVSPAKDGLYLTQHVAVSEHHALGIGSSSRGIKQRSNRTKGGRRRKKSASPASKNAVQGLRRGGRPRLPDRKSTRLNSSHIPLIS